MRVTDRALGSVFEAGRSQDSLPASASSLTCPIRAREISISLIMNKLHQEAPRSPARPLGGSLPFPSPCFGRWFSPRFPAPSLYPWFHGPAFRYLFRSPFFNLWVKHHFFFTFCFTFCSPLFYLPFFAFSLGKARLSGRGWKGKKRYPKR